MPGRHPRQRHIFWASCQKEEFATVIVKSPRARVQCQRRWASITQTPNQRDAAMADVIRILSLFIGSFHAKASLLGWIWIKSISFLIFVAWPLNSFYVLTVYLLPPLIFLGLAHSLLFLEGGKSFKSIVHTATVDQFGMFVLFYKWVRTVQ